jgi:YHYH protein
MGRFRLVRLAALSLASLTLVAACGSEAASEAAPDTVAETPLAPTDAALPVESTAPASTEAASGTTEDPDAVDANPIVNTWSGAVIDPTKLPIGDGSVSTVEAKVGGLWACRAGNPNAGGAQADGPWLDSAADTWDSTTKLAVVGSIVWEEAEYNETVADGSRVITTNNVPVEDPTGTFPIGADDPSFQFDRNPGTITPEAKSVTVPQFGTVADAPSCMNEGPVGLLRNGVFVFNSLDGRGDDAVAHESQDLCNGHPAMTDYHYHNVPSCLRDKATGPSTVVGFAYDGFPIVVERDTAGALPTNADLDECHGRTSPVLLDGEIVTTYHYSATLEFPYFIGCFRGTPL